MHAVPHTLAAVGVQKGENALKNCIAKSKDYMQRANEVAQTGEKPANYNGMDMLVDLESRQELDVKDARGKVFPECCIFNVPKNMFYDIQFILKSHRVS